MRVFASAASSREAAVVAVKAVQVPPLLVLYHQVPLVVSSALMAMPSRADDPSASVTLSTWPLGVAKSTTLETRVPTAPTGAGESSATDDRTGLRTVRTGASF